MEPKYLVPIAISCLALGISILTLYFSRLRSGAITITAGEYISIRPFPEGNCGVGVAITVANSGARPAVVRRFALLIQEGGLAEGYLVEPHMYEGTDEDGNFLYDSHPHPIAVLGNMTETKHVLFRSSLERPDEFGFFKKDGSYRITVLAWLENSVEPQAAERFSIFISDEDGVILEKLRAEKKLGLVTVRQSQWRKWAAKSVTEVEITGLGVKQV